MTDERSRLELSREQILAHRRRVGALDQRLPRSAESLRAAACVGLQDSMPRAALLSIHARVADTPPDVLDDAALAQVWGPRFSAYVVPADAVAAFTLGRLPDDPGRRRRAEETADALDAFLSGRTMTYGEAGRGMGRPPNSLRYAAPTGRVRIRWEGARQPTIWTVPAPEVGPREARLDLVRRYVHVFGPATPTRFEAWAGIRPPGGAWPFSELDDELLAVTTPIGDGWILARDEASFRDASGTPARARLLPSGDAYWLAWGAERELLVPDADRRRRLWTPRVWPGAVLVDGDVAGTWRRAGADLTIEAWRRIASGEREAVEAEAAALPLPDVAGDLRVRWLG